MGLRSFLTGLLESGEARAAAAAASPSRQPVTIVDSPSGMARAVVLPGADRGDVLEVVGESLDQVARREQREALVANRELSVRLTAEPSNPRDPNAVAVQTSAGDAHGYLSRADAPHDQQLVLQIEKRGEVAMCAATRPPLAAPAELDPHGQPFEIRFNRARRAERDLSEFLGLVKGVLADGVVTDAEARHTKDWVDSHADAAEQWPMPAVIERLRRIFADGQIDQEERLDLAELLRALVGGTAGVIVGHDAPTECPLDTPPPVFAWLGAVFVFTGKFAYGTRAACEREVVRRGGLCNAQITKKTNYVVIGTFGSRDWVHTSFGRKIQQAADYRSTGQRLFIVSEHHWGAAIAAPA